MKRGRIGCPIKRGGQTNGRTSHRGRKLSDLRINGIFGALGILRGWCFWRWSDASCTKSRFWTCCLWGCRDRSCSRPSYRASPPPFWKRTFCTGSAFYRTQGSVCSLWEPVALWRSAGDLKGDQSDAWRGRWGYGVARWDLEQGRLCSFRRFRFLLVWWRKRV